APNVFDEWMEMDSPIRRILARQHLRNHGVSAPSDACMISIGEHTVRQLILFAHKAALALYFEHFRLPLSSGGGVLRLLENEGRLRARPAFRSARNATSLPYPCSG